VSPVPKFIAVSVNQRQSHITFDARRQHNATLSLHHLTTVVIRGYTDCGDSPLFIDWHTGCY